MRFQLIALALAFSLSGCAITSGLTIEPGETFVLGGDQRGAFTVELLNTGSVEIEVAEVTVAEDTLRVAQLAPGEVARAHFGARSAALIINRGDVDVTVRATIRGDTNVGMGYAQTR